MTTQLSRGNHASAIGFTCGETIVDTVAPPDPLRLHGHDPLRFRHDGQDFASVVGCWYGQTTAESGAQRDTDQAREPDGLPYLRFDADSLEMFMDWHTTNLETRLRGGNLPPAMESHLDKLTALMVGR